MMDNKDKHQDLLDWVHRLELVDESALLEHFSDLGIVHLDHLQDVEEDDIKQFPLRKLESRRFRRFLQTLAESNWQLDPASDEDEDQFVIHGPLLDHTYERPSRSRQNQSQEISSSLGYDAKGSANPHRRDSVNGGTSHGMTSSDKDDAQFRSSLELQESCSRCHSDTKPSSKLSIEELRARKARYMRTYRNKLKADAKRKHVLDKIMSDDKERKKLRRDTLKEVKDEPLEEKQNLIDSDCHQVKYEDEVKPVPKTMVTKNEGQDSQECDEKKMGPAPQSPKVFRKADMGCLKQIKKSFFPSGLLNTPENSSANGVITKDREKPADTKAQKILSIKEKLKLSAKMFSMLNTSPVPSPMPTSSVSSGLVSSSKHSDKPVLFSTPTLHWNTKEHLRTSPLDQSNNRQSTRSNFPTLSKKLFAGFKTGSSMLFKKRNFSEEINGGTSSKDQSLMPPKYSLRQRCRGTLVKSPPAVQLLGGMRVSYGEPRKRQGVLPDVLKDPNINKS